MYFLTDSLANAIFSHSPTLANTLSPNLSIPLAKQTTRLTLNYLLAANLFSTLQPNPPPLLQRTVQATGTLFFYADLFSTITQLIPLLKPSKSASFDRTSLYVSSLSLLLSILIHKTLSKFLNPNSPNTPKNDPSSSFFSQYTYLSALLSLLANIKNTQKLLPPPPIN